MSKILSLLAAATLAVALAAARASTGPLTLAPATPPDPVSPLSQIPSAKLTLQQIGPLHFSGDFVVGHHSLFHYDSAFDISSRPLAYFQDRPDFIGERIRAPDLLDRVANLLDIDEIDRPWDTTTIVHVFAADPVRGKLVPFATIAHQIDIDEDFERVGLGAGAMYFLQKNVSFGSEVIYYGSDHPSLDGGSNREALFLTRLQIEF